MAQLLDACILQIHTRNPVQRTANLLIVNKYIPLKYIRRYQMDGQRLISQETKYNIRVRRVRPSLMNAIR